MKTQTIATLRQTLQVKAVALATFGAFALHIGTAKASIAYGSINNFDTVNDTGHECHGFEIELDDIHSTDITYTYDYNHYGAPKITEDNSNPAHPKVFVSYQSAKNADGTWAAFTAIPSAPIAPTMGHQFTNPSVNFGGEHFGVGYRANPSSISYNWLIDNGAGVLTHGGAVSIATPVFVYVPPAAGAPAQLQAAIVPPPPPLPPVIVYEFGHPSWVKEIRTTSHNNSEVRLRDLVSDDPANPPVKSWRNGEPDEVEMEWQLMQTDSGKPNGGANAELKGAPENLAHGDEVVTRRYEFYEYLGPVDPETHEALAGTVAADGIHGTGANAAVVVVGKYLGAQMSAANAVAPVGLIDHLPDGALNEKYTDRTIVIAGSAPFVAPSTGALPDGMSFDAVTGVISGTPTVSGVFSFTVNATAGTDPSLSKTYTLNIAAAGVALLPHSLIDTSVSPANAGTVVGNGSYDNGSNILVTATPAAGYTFLNWTDNGAVVSQSPDYTFTTDVNRTLTAHFVVACTLTLNAVGGIVTKVPDQASYAPGTVVTLTATADPLNIFNGWSGDASGTTNPLQVTMNGSKTITAAFPLYLPLTVTPGAAANGTISPNTPQVVNSGNSIGFTATPSPNGYGVDQWWVNGISVQSGGAHFTLANVTATTSVMVTFKKAVPVLGAFAPGPWTPGDVVTDLIIAENHPTKFNVTGLPAGVVLNARTGQLGGRPSAAISATRTYHLVVTASNVTGTSAPLKVDVFVKPLPTAVIGSFIGLVDHDAGLGGGLGGTISIVSTSNGSYTGRLAFGTLSYPLLGGLLNDPLGANASSTLLIKRSGKLPSLTLAFVIDKTTGGLVGTVTDGIIATPVNLTAWKAVAPVAQVAATYTAALELDPALVGTGTTATNVNYPQGTGFGTLAITPAGVSTWAGRMADGTVTNGSSHTVNTTTSLGNDIPLHFLLYSGTGSAHGWITATPDSATTPTNAGHPLLDGALDWNKSAQSVSTRTYKSGFPLHQLTVTGGGYTKPGAGQFVIGLLDNSGGNNAKFAFSEGGLNGPAPIVAAVGAASLDKPFRIAASGAVTLPKGAANPASLTLSLNSSTGAFSGGFVLTGDPDPTKPSVKISRAASFYGLLIPRLGVPQGLGFFLLGELPSAAPRTTAATSPVLSGQVLIEAGP